MLTDTQRKRLKAITDIFFEINGITFETTVAANELDANPEKNIVIFEEMVRVYKSLCEMRPLNYAEKREAYNVLLTRSFYSDQETIDRLNLNVLPLEDAAYLIIHYSLEPEPLIQYE